jgi:putative ABC transport system ATP-binding protein
MGDSIVRALDGVDLDIETGEFVAITGPSGSGKSTIMHLIGCLDRPTGGHYWLNGRDVSDMSDRELARIRNKSVGFVFQTFNLINRTTAVDNVAVPLFYARRANTRGPARRALERVGLTARSSHTPAELSGGERQRVAIARAIVNDPLLLLADEPTGNLDSRTGQQIMEIVSALNEQGVTIILVTHEPEVAARAKRVVHMLDGKVVSDEPTTPRSADARQPPTQVTAESVAATTEPAAAAEPAVAQAVAPPPTNAPGRVEMTARFAGGANGSLGCGVAAPVLLVIAFVAIALAQRTAGDPQQFGPENPPPANVVLLGFGGVLSLLLAIIMGFIGIFWGRAVLRRIRAVPGAWIGARRARAGWICGLVTVLVPVLLIALQVAMHVVRSSRA